MRRRSIILATLRATPLAASALVCACASPPEPDALSSRDPAGRMHAAASAAAAGDTSAVPALVEMLASDDPAERMVAIGALERLTGERMGFAAAASPGSRAEAVARWRAWLEREHPLRRPVNPPTLPPDSNLPAPLDR